jgi:hypothetical protein
MPLSTPETISLSGGDGVLDGVLDVDLDIDEDGPDNERASDRNPDRGLVKFAPAPMVSFEASNAEAEADMVRCRRRPRTAGGREVGDEAGGADMVVSSGGREGWEERGRKAGCMVV